jgi:hypothetical protein
MTGMFASFGLLRLFAAGHLLAVGSFLAAAAILLGMLHSLLMVRVLGGLDRRACRSLGAGDQRQRSHDHFHFKLLKFDWTLRIDFRRCAVAE